MKLIREKKAIIIKRKIYCFLMERFNRIPRLFRSAYSKHMYKPIIHKTASIAGLPIYLGKVRIGKYSFLNGNAYLENVSIGNYCSIGRDLHIISGNHDMKSFSTYTFWSFNKKSPFVDYVDVNEIEKFGSGKEGYMSKQTVIGHDVWIGSFVNIIGGVTIGTGAVIGAGAVVTKDVPPYAIVAGCPAKIIRYRFEKEKCDKLLASKWWKLSSEDLADNWEYLNNI